MLLNAPPIVITDLLVVVSATVPMLMVESVVLVCMRRAAACVTLVPISIC